MTIDNEIENNLKTIDELNFHLTDWSDELMERVKIDFTYFSNKIEGNALTYGETIGILAKGIQPKQRSLQDVFNIETHKSFIDKLFDSYHTDISVEYIIDLHKLFMESIFQWSLGTGDNYSPGILKWANNGAMRPNGEMKYFMDYKKVPNALEELCRKTNEDLKQQGANTVLIASNFHQRFIGEIHPFVDGNGRLGRILTNQILLRGGLSPVSFEFGEKSRLDYIKMMDISDTTKPDTMKESYLFFSNMVVKTIMKKASRQ